MTSVCTEVCTGIQSGLRTALFRQKHHYIWNLLSILTIPFVLSDYYGSFKDIQRLIIINSYTFHENYLVKSTTDCTTWNRFWHACIYFHLVQFQSAANVGTLLAKRRDSVDDAGHALRLCCTKFVQIMNSITKP